MPSKLLQTLTKQSSSISKPCLVKTSLPGPCGLSFTAVGMLVWVKIYSSLHDELGHFTHFIVSSWIGKSALGEQMLNYLPDFVKDEGFKTLLKNRTLYLRVEMNGAGDQYNAGDDLLKPNQRMAIRLLARSCGVSARQFRSFRSHEFDDLLASLEKKGMHAVAKEARIARPKSAIANTNIIPQAPPLVEKVLGALARDYRKAIGVDQRGLIGMVIVVDEHQLFYEAVRSEKKDMSEGEALLLHKNFLYPLMTCRGDTVWCKDNNVFLMPIFLGTSHYVLSELWRINLYGRVYVPIDPMSISDAREAFKAKVGKIDEGWIKTTRSGQAPLDLILGEVLRVPRYVFENIPLFLKDVLARPPTPAVIVDRLHAIHGGMSERFGKISILPEALFASLAGMRLRSDQIESLGHAGLHDVSILSPRPFREGQLDEKVILFTPILVLRHLRATIASGHFEALSVSYFKEGPASSFSAVWEKCVAERIGMIFAVHRFLRTNISFGDLFGSKYQIMRATAAVPMPEDSHWTEYEMPKMPDGPEEKNPLFIHAKHRIFQEPRQVDDDWLVSFPDFCKAVVGFMNIANHPIIDVVLSLKAARSNKRTFFYYSCKGPHHGLSAPSPTLTVEKDMEGLSSLISEIQQHDRRANDRVASSNDEHVLVYFLAGKLHQNEFMKMKDFLSKPEDTKSRFPNNLAVILVDDVEDVSPILAHRFLHRASQLEDATFGSPLSSNKK